MILPLALIWPRKPDQGFLNGALTAPPAPTWKWLPPLRWRPGHPMINVDIQSGVLDHNDCSSEVGSKSIEKSASDGGLRMSEQRAGHGQRRACVHPARSQLLGSSATRDVIFVFHCKKRAGWRLALTLERGAYWRTPRRVRIPINEFD